VAMIGGAGELKDGGQQAGSTQSMLRIRYVTIVYY